MKTSWQIAFTSWSAPALCPTLCRHWSLRGASGPTLKNEMMLPAVLDPWAAARCMRRQTLPPSTREAKLWLVSLGPKAKLQQVMMTVAQKVPFELVVDRWAAGWIHRCTSTAAALAEAIAAIPGSGSRKAASLWRMGVGFARSRRDLADAGRAAGNLRSVPGRGPDHGERRWFVRGVGAGGGRQTPGLGVRGHPGRAGMGDGQSAGAAQQSAGWNGKHARHHARDYRRQRA